MSNKMVVLALALCLLLLSGCQSQQEDTMEGKIQGVVETVFTIQEGEQMELLQACYSQEALTNPEREQAYYDYLWERLPAEDFTPECYEELPRGILGSMGFPGFCAASGATIQPQEVQVSLTAKESRVYGYTAQLEVSLEGEAATVEVEGRVQLDEEEKIAFFKADQLEDLLNAVNP